MITSNHSGITGTTTTLGYSGTVDGGTRLYTNLNNTTLTTTSNGSNYTSLSTAVTHLNNMNKQVKVAVFTVERNKDNKVTSSTFVKELWVEIKNGASLELSVAKQLDKDFDPSTTIIKELSSVTF